MMKRSSPKFLLFFLMSLLVGKSAFLQAQSLKILDAPSQPITGYYDDGSDLQSTMYVKNTSSSDKDVKAFRNPIDEVQGSRNQFCWSPQCWSYSTDTPSVAQTISANGGIDSTFKAYYDPQGNPGITTIQYCFYVEGDPSDSTCTVVRYDASEGVSIEERKKDEIVLNVAPNPASKELTVNLGKGRKGSLRIVSILGELVLERRVERNESELELDVSGLKEGLHFLNFERNDGRKVTKKVMIRRN